MASWREVVAFSQPLTKNAPDDVVTYGVARPLPVIVWDAETRQRRVVPMRWGFPHPKDWRRPQPIHARSEGIDTTKAVALAFKDGQRGIVVFQTFNEGEETLSSGGKPKTIQWTIDPGDGARARSFATTDEGLPLDRSAYAKSGFSIASLTTSSTRVIPASRKRLRTFAVSHPASGLWMFEAAPIPAPTPSVRRFLSTLLPLEAATGELPLERNRSAAMAPMPSISLLLKIVWSAEHHIARNLESAAKLHSVQNVSTTSPQCPFWMCPTSRQNFKMLAPSHACRWPTNIFGPASFHDSNKSRERYRKT